MERLTMIDGIGNDELVRCMGCGLEKAGENLENCGFCEEGWQKALKKLAAYENTGLEPEDIFAEWLAEYLVKSLSTFAPPNKWVSVEERLPEIGGSYLCVWQGRKIDTGFFLNGHFRLYGEIKDHLITHWMPLPALPDHRLPEEGRKTDGQ